MTLPSRLPRTRRNAKRPISTRPLHPFAEIDAPSSGVLHFNKSGTFRAWRTVENDIDVIHRATSHCYCPARQGLCVAVRVADIVRYRSRAMVADAGGARPFSEWP